MKTLEEVDGCLNREGVRGEVQDLKRANGGDALKILLEGAWNISYQIFMNV